MNRFLNEVNAAKTFIETAKHNILKLADTLTSVGYEFANRKGAVQLSSESTRELLNATEAKFGELPMLLKMWYHTFACVDFSQSKDQLYGSDCGAVAGLGLNCTLVFLDLESCIELRSDLSEAFSDTLRMNGRTFLPLGGVASNCDPKGIWIPSNEFDPVIYNDGAGPISFASEVRTAIHSGGFPFWDRMFRRTRFASPLGFSPAFNQLRPILTQDLLPL
jgi:hypothetical protein